MTVVEPAREASPAVQPTDGSTPAAPHAPVAVVLVDVPLAHLDRPFEYAVPAAWADLAVPGARVKARFAGRDVDGFVIARREQAEHPGALRPLRRVVSPEPVLTAGMADLVRAVATQYAGTVSDVLRLAVPPRHARAERALSATADPPPDPPAPGLGPWAAYPAGASFLRRVTQGGAPWAAWTARPTTDAGQDWPRALAVAAATALSAGRGALLVVPDSRDVERVGAQLVGLLGPDAHVRLTADQGPQARYTAWLRLLRGHVRCVVGTRAAAFAPVANLGLVAWWDDGDDSLSEPRAPYPQVREVLRAHAELTGAALLVGGFLRSASVQEWVERGVLRPVVADAARRRDRPRVLVAGEDHDRHQGSPGARARLPSLAWQVARDALTRGPVLVSTPRSGYLPALSCDDCRAPARCPGCGGPLAQTEAGGSPTCRWCGAARAQFECGHCSGRRWRSVVVGDQRTAVELGRAFPGTAVHTSGAGHVLAEVPATPALVVATPGAEPTPAAGYAATLLLDAWLALELPGLDAGQEALRRWLAAAALTVPARDGGTVVVCGAPTHLTAPAVEALVRWDPDWHSARDLAQRRELALPPTVAVATLRAPPATLAQAARELRLPAGAEVVGPLPVAVTSPELGDLEQLIVRAPLATSAALAEALRELRAGRSARKQPGLTVRLGLLDPTR